MCRVTGVSRAGFYRQWQEREPDAEEMELRAQIQQIVVHHRRNYGYRRVTWDLHELGWVVNHKRVARIMKQDNLLAIRRSRFVPTTNSRHDLLVYPNRARHLQLTGVDQLWVADITYIRLQQDWVFLAVILDAYSRRVIGWALERTLEDELTLAALRMALSRRIVEPGLVHHSDRGSQYASNDYTDLLKAHGIEISMSRKGNPWDNAACESFMKTLK
jgi:transposase InsO family protein